MNDKTAFRTPEEFMRHAYELARASVAERNGTPYAALIVKDGEIIAEGLNTTQHDFDPTAHSDIVAMRKAGASLKVLSLAGCTLYTTCEPCAMCAAAIYWSGIRDIYYGAGNDDCAHELDLDPINAYVQPPFGDRGKQILRAEGVEIFEAWYATDYYPTMWPKQP